MIRIWLFLMQAQQTRQYPAILMTTRCYHSSDVSVWIMTANILLLPIYVVMVPLNLPTDINGEHSHPYRLHGASPANRSWNLLTIGWVTQSCVSAMVWLVIKILAEADMLLRMEVQSMIVTLSAPQIRRPLVLALLPLEILFWNGKPLNNLT